ncbi:MAG: hypothetical protein ACYCU8_01065 [Ferrimicrobium acidiphilum]
MAGLIRSEEGVIDEFIGMIGAFFMTMILILFSIPVTSMIQSVASANDAARLAAQASLSYEFPLQQSQAESESSAVFAARVQGENLSCSPLAITPPSIPGGTYSVSSSCAVTPLGMSAARFSITVHASVRTSIYQGAG